MNAEGHQNDVHQRHHFDKTLSFEPVEQKVAILQKTQENDGLHEEHEQEASG